jgi:pimeloyl-ACP methyl ester carboxylesterase
MTLSRPSTAIVALTLCFTAAVTVFAADNATSFRVAVTGTGRPIIFIPGLASSGETWDGTVVHYRGRFTCHVLTLAGFAGQPPIDGPLLATVRRDLARYIREKQLDRPIIIGHSLGGLLALALAADHPDLVGPLVIVDALPFFAGPSMQVKTAAEAQPAIAAMEGYMSKMTQEQWDAYANSGASTRYMVTSAADHQTLTKWSMATDRQTLTRVMVEMYGTDLREDIARITVPVLVLGTWRGIHDQMASRIEIPRADFVKEFAAQFARVPRLHFALHDTARHFIMWDDPMWFFSEVDAFITDPAASVRQRGFDARN